MVRSAGTEGGSRGGKPRLQAKKRKIFEDGSGRLTTKNGTKITYGGFDNGPERNLAGKAGPVIKVVKKKK